MRILSRTKSTEIKKLASYRGRVSAEYFFVLTIAASVWMQSCGGGGGITALVTPSPPKPAVVVAVTPASSSLILGNSQTFVATVTNATNTSVTWAVNGVHGGNATLGQISASGVFTAPGDLPTPANVNITATSQADTTKSASAAITITSDISLTITPNAAGVLLGATQGFQSSITSAGHPDTAVRWSISGRACPANCGTVATNGNYTAPQVLPSPASATLTAQSVADPSKQASASIIISGSFSLLLSAPSTTQPGGTATVVATLTPAAGSNPSTVLNWTLSGPGCSGSSCGTLAVVTTQVQGGNVTAISATYDAPTVAPSPNTVTVTVTPQADPSKVVQATIAIQSGAGVSLTPMTATLAANHRVTLTAQIGGTSNTAATWNVNGVAGGNATLGLICVVGSNPCQSVTGTSTLQVDYLAPGTIPSPNPVSVQIVTVADATKFASSQITILNHVAVSVLPGSATLSPLAIQAFTASVLGTANQSVVWQVQGAGCAGGLCGSVDANGAYTAPLNAPSPDALQVVAVSSDDTTQSGQASVAISTGISILTLHPASVYARAANGFTLQVDGSGYSATTPGPASTLLIGGTARTTTCSSTLECIAPVTAVDVAIAGNVIVQIQNPDRTKSNAVSLIVVPANASDAAIALTAGAPIAEGNNIVVVEPTTAGVSVVGDDVDLNVAALGTFSTANNSCVLAGNPVTLLRPASGTGTADICLFSQSGLDSSMTYTISGPGDITAIAKQPAGLGIIHLTLQIPATAAQGSRTIFIQNTNLDKTAASGSLEVN
jgi:hypothetical protein